MRALILSIIFAATASPGHALFVQALDVDIHDWDRSKGIKTDGIRPNPLSETGLTGPGWGALPMASGPPWFPTGCS